MIVVSQDLNDERLYAVLEFLQAGSDNAKILFYDGTQPDPGEVPTGDLISEMLLQTIPGEVDAHVLTLLPDEDSLVVKSGVPTWARCVTANNSWAFDCTCSDDAGDGDIKFDETLLAGGAIRLLTCELT